MKEAEVLDVIRKEGTMNLALKSYLNSMSEHEKNSYVKHMISTQSWRLEEIKNLDPGWWKAAQEKANTDLREGCRANHF